MQFPVFWKRWDNLAKNFHASYMKCFHQAIGMDYDGERLGCAMEDSAGALTFNVGTVNMDENGRIFLQCNICYPASVEYNDIRELLERQLKNMASFIMK